MTGVGHFRPNSEGFAHRAFRFAPKSGQRGFAGQTATGQGDAGNDAVFGIAVREVVTTWVA